MHAATLTPSADWPANFGLGGLFGDTVLGVVLTIMPFGAVFGVKLLSLLSGLALLALLAFALGFTRPELKIASRFTLLGTVMLYALVLRVLGKGASLSAQAAQGVSATVQARREQFAETRAARLEEPALNNPHPIPPLQDARARAASVVRSNPAMPLSEPRLTAPKMPPAPPLAAPVRAPMPEPQGGGFLSGLLKRNEPMPEPELVSPEPLVPRIPYAGDTDRVSARIADAIKNRSVPPSPTGVRIEPTLTAGRGPKPLVFAPIEEDMSHLEDLIEPEIDAPRMATPHMPIPEAHIPAPSMEPRSVVRHPPKRMPQPSSQARAEAQPALKFDDKYADYERPPLGLLTSPVEIQRHHLSDEALEENARMLESVLDDYGVKGDIVSVRPGPVVTMYELEPAPGLKASRVIGLSDDIARSMSALSARVSTVPGRSVIGIELPTENREKVVLREILSHRDFGDGNQKLPL
ncbi:MAG: DNA translocase FtsK, partial [Paracoccaceae bacterium]|nr:DNA translocase FtsK [Paracoccaceae bacterium]